jgi:hypothetical protein
MVSFGFVGDRYVAVSIETRKERGEAYSTIAGFFKQYELVYVVGDERDLIRVRTNYREPREDVYVYRVRAPRENLRRVFLDYLRELNALGDHPAFYNTLTTNCTTSILVHTRVNPGAPPFSWKVLLSGYLPEYTYELGRLDTSLPFDELRRRSRVNESAQAADRDPDFSRRIREGLPGMTPDGPGDDAPTPEGAVASGPPSVPLSVACLGGGLRAGHVVERALAEVHERELGQAEEHAAEPRPQGLAAVERQERNAGGGPRLREPAREVVLADRREGERGPRCVARRHERSRREAHAAILGPCRVDLE